MFALTALTAGLARALSRDPGGELLMMRLRCGVAVIGVLALAAALSLPPAPAAWPLARGFGGFWGDGLLTLLAKPFALVSLPAPRLWAGLLWAVIALASLGWASASNATTSSPRPAGCSRSQAARPSAAPAARGARDGHPPTGPNRP